MATHTTKDLVWVRYNPRTMLISTALLSPAAALAHRQLADYAWSEKPWLAPDSPAFLAATRLTPELLAGVLTELKSAGWRIRNKTISHAGLQAEVVGSQAMRASARARGRAGNAVRWKKPAGTIAQNSPRSASQPAIAKASQPAVAKASQEVRSHYQPTDQPTDQPTNQPTNQEDLKRLTAERLTVATPVEIVSRLSGSPPLQGGTPEADPNACRPGALTRRPDLQRGTDEEDPNACRPGALTRRPDLQGGTPEAPNPSPENKFLAELLVVLERYSPASAQAELTNWGGWWRNAFRTDPDKSRRVLADTNNMISEGRITSNPGAAAADLWRRLPS